MISHHDQPIRINQQGSVFHSPPVAQCPCHDPRQPGTHLDASAFCQGLKLFLQFLSATPSLEILEGEPNPGNIPRDLAETGRHKLEDGRNWLTAPQMQCILNNLTSWMVVSKLAAGGMQFYLMHLPRNPFVMHQILIFAWSSKRYFFLCRVSQPWFFWAKKSPHRSPSSFFCSLCGCRFRLSWFPASMGIPEYPDTLWIPYGYPMDTLWIPYGYPMVNWYPLVN